MSFLDQVNQAQSLLESSQSVSLRALKREFLLDDESLEDLVEELVEIREVAELDGKILRWVTATSTSEATKEQGERRQLTVMFCDLVGSTELAQQMDPEEFGEILQNYRIACDESARSFDGHIAQYLGDGVLIYFGYPQAMEDATDRAIRSGLKIQTLLSEKFHGKINARIGIHTGPVVLDPTAAGDKALALGSATNVAARIQNFASPGAVLASSTTIVNCRSHVESKNLGQTELKGVEGAVELFEILRISSKQRSSQDFLTQPMFGRDSELSKMLHSWKEVRKGMFQKILIHGEAGIGKSKLVQSFRDQVKSESQKWFDLQCSQFTSGSAFQPMIDLQSSYFGLADTSTPQAARDSLIEAVEALPGIDPAEVVPYLLAILKLPAIEKYPILQTSTNEQRDRTLKAMLALISAMAKQSPTVMVLEDLHWCDPSTLEFLAKLIEGSQSQQLLLLATSRPDYKYPWDNNMIDLISLNKLSVEHTREMIRQAAGADVPESVIDELEKRSDGVPLFIGELTSNVVGSSEKIEIDGQITLKIDLDKLSIPTTLQDSLMAKLDKLGGAKLVAQYAATFGREFSFRLLQLVSEFDEAFLGESLGSLELAGVVEEVGAVPGSQYSFKHALLQDAAYESLLMSTRRKIHARIVEALQRYFPKRVESEPEVIARHCAAADLQNDAVEYYQRAAELAEQRLSNEEASLHYQSAIKALESQEVGESRHQREILLRLAQNKAITAMEGFETSAVHANTARIEALCNSFEQREQKLPALMGLLEFDSIRGNLLNSKDRAMELLEIAESVNLPIAIATANLILGGTDSETGKLKSAEQRYKLVIEMPISKQLPPPATSNDLEFLSLALAAYACTFATLCKFQQCYDTAQQCIQRALEYGNDATRANTYAMVSLCGFQMQDPYLVEQYADKAIDYSGGRGFHATETMAKILKGWSYKVLNNSADCVPQMEQGLQIAKQTGVVGGLPLLHCAAAETYSMCGDQSKAMQQVEEASNLANTNGAVGYVPWIMNSKARIMLAKDDCNIPEVSDLLMASYFMASEQSNNFAKFVAATRLAEIAREPQEIEISYQRLCDEIEELDENPNSLSWKDAREALDRISKLKASTP